MLQETICRNLIVVALTLASATVALAQAPTYTKDVPLAGGNRAWQTAESGSSAKGRLFVVTVDQPERRHACHVQSITAEKLVCSRAFGGSRTYLTKQVLALIVPGNRVYTDGLLLGFNVGLGASIWGTVVLAATCPVCAAATALAAFVFFDAAGVVLITGNEPERLLYLAPGKQLSGKLGAALR